MKEITKEEAIRFRQDVKKIIKLKEKIKYAGLDEMLSSFVYMPAIPIYGIEKRFVIDVVLGVKIAHLVSTPDD